jgi:membrane protein DedA with SNARE-associated domain
MLADQRTGPTLYCLAGCALFFGLPVSMGVLAGFVRSSESWLEWRFEPITVAVIAGVLVLSLAILRAVAKRNRRQ